MLLQNCTHKYKFILTNTMNLILFSLNLLRKLPVVRLHTIRKHNLTPNLWHQMIVCVLQFPGIPPFFTLN